MRIALALAAVLTTTAVAPASHAGDEWKLWTGLGALALGTAAGAMFFYENSKITDAQDDPAIESYRRRFPSSETNVCERARAGQEGPPGALFGTPLAAQAAEKCDETEARQTRRWVWLGAHAALITTGVVLLVTRKPRPETKTAAFDISPVVGPRVSAITLTVRF